MTNNFDEYKHFIEKMSPDFPKSNKAGNADKFYCIEIMRRGKDNPELSAANYHYKNYYIYCWNDFDRFESEIKQTCDIFRMRAYASVNWKSTKQIALNTVAAMAKRIADGDFKKIYSEWESQTGHYSNRSNSIWIMDCDDIYRNSNEEKLIKNLIASCASQFENIILDTLPTRSGCHILTKPFDRKTFCKKLYENTEVLNLFPELVEKLKNGSPNKFIVDQMLDWLNNNLIKVNHLTLLYENV